MKQLDSSPSDIRLFYTIPNMICAGCALSLGGEAHASKDLSSRREILIHSPCVKMCANTRDMNQNNPRRKFCLQFTKILKLFHPRSMMILRELRRVMSPALLGNMRNYSFKPIKRPDFNSPASKAFVERKLKDFNLKQILQAKIKFSGPLTGELSCSFMSISITCGLSQWLPT